MLLCRKLDLFGRELLAVDGTRLKAVNSTDRNFTREKLVKMIRSADERLADYLTRLDRTDAEENVASGCRAKNLTEKIAALKERKTRHEGLLEELERTGQSQVSLTDPDSRAMASHPKVGVGYNAQVAFDAKHKLIVEQPAIVIDASEADCYLMSLVENLAPPAPQLDRSHQRHRQPEGARLLARDDLVLMQPLRFFMRGQARGGDAHVFAPRSRFIAAVRSRCFRADRRPLLLRRRERNDRTPRRHHRSQDQDAGNMALMTLRNDPSAAN